MKMMNRKIEDLIKIKFARLSFSTNHSHTIIVECHFLMNLMTCKEIFLLHKKIRKRSSEKALNDEFSSSSRSSIHHFHQVLDLFDQKIVFGFFHTDEKKFIACHQVHTKTTLNDDRRSYKE
jgi:hypothetical protein